MERSRKAIIIGFIVGMSVFGYSQYAAASQTDVEVKESDLIEKNENISLYDVELEFDNPSLLLLTAGETDFLVIADEKIIGDGKLEPFTLSPLTSKLVQGTFQTESNEKSKDTPVVKISGTTKYDLFLTSLEVPFVYYPTEDQARKFIHQD